jgi:hypothetical protein
LASKALARLETQSQTAIRVKEFGLKKDEFSDRGGVDITDILAAARLRLGAAVNPESGNDESPDEKTA